MCLVALAWKTHPRWRWLMAGNRDELHARPTAPLAEWRLPAGVKAGRDLRSGGTWVGADARGRCAVVTNVRDPLAASTGPSRGQLPVRFLQGGRDALATTTALASDAAGYAPFNLLLVDADACAYLGNHPRLEQHAIAPGIHGMSNGGFDVAWPKTRRLCGALEKWIDSGEEDLAPLWNALADERIAEDSALPDTGVGIELERLLSAAFIRGQAYGTRASTLIAIDYEGRGFISERRFGPNGLFEGETTLSINTDP
ncbi:NRDE family protein [Pseudoxanthomonas gei]|uniref:NRDE family protein n=1 Tax=Pseudoxanthomonas gei TaxID=1383030 RepID=A0ABX0A956_9GAMM|nr:NRDE family protein [Pseudoxanthomonas gei]NDK38059.1 NRDE family protein [Pseudoxanthomonas gei]